jgi:predicted RNA-binding Zn-ribbon protein involved in translation (DUF1610 family)
MSQPRTVEEWKQQSATAAVAGPADNVVSTACPSCGVRFAMLASYSTRGWWLRCTLCGDAGYGELKAKKEEEGGTSDGASAIAGTRSA